MLIASYERAGEVKTGSFAMETPTAAELERRKRLTLTAFLPDLAHSLRTATKGPVMTTKIFVNLPVKDLAKSMAFFKSLGWTFNPQFTDDTAACMVISDDIYAMLLTHDEVQAVHRQEDRRRRQRRGD